MTAPVVATRTAPAARRASPRPPAWVSRARPVTMVTLLATLVLWAAAKQIDGEIGRRAAINALQLAAAFATAGVAGRRAAAAAGRTRQHLVLLSVAALAWAAGQAYWTVSEVVLSRAVPFPSAADVGFLLAYPLLAAAVLRAPSSQTHPRSGLRQSLDWLAVAGALVFVGWATMLDSVFAELDPTSAAGALGMTYPLADVALVTVGLGGVATARPPWRPALALVATGVASLGVADTGFAYLTSSGAYATGSAVDLGWIAGWMLVALGARAVPMGDPISTGGAVEPPGLTATVVLLAALGGVVVTVTVMYLAGEPFTDDPFLWWVGLGLFVLNMARAFAARLEGDAHAAELSCKAEELTRLVQRHGLALDTAGMGTWEWSAATGVVWWSPELERLLGMAPGSFGGTVEDALAPLQSDDLVRSSGAVGAVIERGGGDFTVDCRALRADGSPIWVQCRGHVVVDADGALTGVVGVAIDVSERVAADQQRETRLRQGVALAELGQRAMTATTLQDVFDDAVLTLAATTGVELAKVLRLEPGGAALRLVAGCGWMPGLVGVATVGTGVDSQAGFTLACRAPVVVENLASEARFRGPALLADHGVISGMSTVIHTAEGSWGVLGAHTARHRAFGDDDVTFLRSVANVAGAAVDRAAIQDELRRRALHDTLTGLPNRTLLHDRLAVGIARAGRVGRQVAVVHVGLDRFTLVNQSFGQAAGDQVLVEIARRLSELCGPGDTAARLEGDEFVVTTMVDAPDEAVDLATRALAIVGEPMVVGDPPEEVFLSASVGVAVANGKGDAASTLRDASSAADRASARGGRRYELFDDGFRIRSVERLRTERELRRAIAEGEFEAHYQPIVRVADGALAAVEALARWRHPARGLLGPAEFIEAAEAAGLIGAVGAAMLAQAAEKAAEWTSAWQGPVAVSVNVSTSQLTPELVATVEAALRTAGAPPAGLCLEIVETALADDDGTARRVLDALKQIGPLAVHIDDFGTGHSSLSRLASFPVDGIKIDRSFVTNLVDHPTDRAVAAAIIQLGDALGLDVVAEGVETLEQLDILRELGCELVQGWLFAPAMPAAEVDVLVAHGRAAFAHVVRGGTH